MPAMACLGTWTVFQIWQRAGMQRKRTKWLEVSGGHLQAPPTEFLQAWGLDKPFPASHLCPAFLKTWALLLPLPVPALGSAKG